MKDIFKEHYKYAPPSKSRLIEFLRLDSNLKQEAIKEIESIMELEKTPSDKWWEEMTGHRLTYSEEAKQGIINYIKWKFNITEEDLK